MMSKPVWRYLDVRVRGALVGRGGEVRTFLLANDIPFDEELVVFKDWWDGEKERTIKDDINCCGVLPSLKVDGRWYGETSSMVRYLARRNGLYGVNVETDYEQDALVNACHVWRDAWVAVLYVEPDSEAMKTYLDKRDYYYACMERMYARRSNKDNMYMAGGEKPGMADTTLWSMINDDMELHGKFDLDAYPNVAAVYEAVGAIASVESWLQMWRARTDF